MSRIRLNKFLASCGISSRRAADKLIREGKVKVNGIVVREMGIKIDPEKDKVIVGELQVQPQGKKVYYMLNKPKGYVCSSFDPFYRKKVIDLVPREPRVFSVGRLDRDTRGLLILTNDGNLTYKLTHPKFEKEKEYIVQVRKQENKKLKKPACRQAGQENKKTCLAGSPVACLSADRTDRQAGKKTRKEDLNIEQMLKQGVRLKEGIAKADRIEVLEQKGDFIKFRIVIHQGWKRQIRRMCDKIGFKVLDLKRVRVGDLELKGLKEGRWRKLSKKEIESLLK